MIASVGDLKKHLNITSSTDDDELVDILDAAERVVVSIAGDWSSGTVTESVPVSGGTAILGRRPSGAVLVNGSPVGGYVDRAAGVITGLVGYSNYSGMVPPRLTVTYDVGAAGVPAAIRLAVLIIAAHLWETQRGPSPVGPLAAEDPFATPGVGYAIPNRAQELLAPYTRPVIA